MASKNVLEYCVLNIVTHPHSPQQYIDIFKMAFRGRFTANVNINTSAMILSAFNSKNVFKWSTDPIEGEVCKFVNIDIDGDWLNIETRKMAKDKETSKIVIPDYLKPNTQKLDFFFYPDKHLLFVETKERKNSMSPHIAKKVFELILNNPKIVAKYGKVTVTIEPETDKVDQAVNMASISKIEYRMTRPNPDILDIKEEELVSEMNAEYIGEVTTVIKSQEGAFLKLNEEKKLLARIAARNGYVKANGYDKTGKKLSIDTSSHPLKVKVSYDPNTQTTFSAMLQSIPKVLSKIFKN